MKQHQVILLLVIPIAALVASFALAVTITTMSNSVLAQTSNITDTYVNEYQFITKWGSLGTEPGQFDGPSGLAVDNEDNIYVTENDNHRIQKFTSDGEFLASWGSEGIGDGQFNRPEGIDVDPLGRAIVADTGNNRIQIFN
jgi:DNA-binding beta-propeller fold protein YncE